MAHHEIQCSLCGRYAVDLLQGGGGDERKVHCRACGRYRMTGSLAAMLLSDRYADVKPYLSIYTRQASERAPVEDLIASSPLLTEYNFETIGTAQLSIAPIQKAAALLEVLGKRTKHLGALAPFNPADDFPLIGSIAIPEARFLLDFLSTDGLIEPSKPHGGLEFVVTLKGWQQLMPDGGRDGIPGTCFVAMSFEETLIPVFDEGIAPAVESDCGFTVIRLDRVEHNENITDKILADLRKAQFIVADFTHHRCGVYFEAGFALALGRPVIWTCERSGFQGTHVDTRPYNYILWTTAQELREKLVARIRGTITNARLG